MTSTFDDFLPDTESEILIRRVGRILRDKSAFSRFIRRRLSAFAARHELRLNIHVRVDFLLNVALA